jgi:hypothetical protein
MLYTAVICEFLSAKQASIPCCMRATVELRHYQRVHLVIPLPEKATRHGGKSRLGRCS